MVKIDSCRGFCHICMYYDTLEEQISGLKKIFVRAIKEGKKCLYVTSENSVEQVGELFGSCGGELLKKSIKDGKLLILGKEETYLLNGVFNAKRTIELVKKIIKETLDDGYSGLVAAGEMSWAIEDIPGMEELPSYESMLNSLEISGDVVFICQYKRSLYPREFLKIQERIHPYVFSNKKITLSPRFFGRTKVG